MVDIQSATAEITRGIKKRRQKSQGKNIMSTSATQGGHNNVTNLHHLASHSTHLVLNLCSLTSQKTNQGGYSAERISP